MEAKKAINKLINNCDIFYDKEIISNQPVVVDYLKFMSNQYPMEKNISFTLHTGSIAFDIVAIVTSVISSLMYNENSNEDIISSLNKGDMVVYKNERYKWGGLEEFNGTTMMVLEKESKKNENSKIYSPYKLYKHMVSIYNGNSHTTDGRGIRNKKTHREDFFAYIYDLPENEIPSAIDATFVVVSEKSFVDELIKNINIHYEDKIVYLSELVATSYYTSGGEEIIIGKNPTKKEPELKFTSKISTARDIILDKSGNKAVGLLILKTANVVYNNSEFQDLLKRKKLKNVNYMSNYDLELGEKIVKDNQDGAMFACTPSYLRTLQIIKHQNKKIGMNLTRQIENLTSLNIEELNIKSEMTIQEAVEFKKAIIKLKNSNIEENEKNEFVIKSYSLFQLLTTAPFKLQLLENLLEEGRVYQNIYSPQYILNRLRELSEKIFESKNETEKIISILHNGYMKLYENNARSRELESIIRNNIKKQILIVVPKEYYINILKNSNIFGTKLSNVKYVSANKFDEKNFYDVIITIGDLHNKKFPMFECFSSPKIYVLNSECQKKYFTNRRRKAALFEKKILNKHREKNIVLNEDNVLSTNENRFETFEDDEISEYIDSLNYIPLNTLKNLNYGISNNSGNSEVSYIGKFVTGENIFFSKYYTAVVYDVERRNISEKKIEKISVGDSIVFTKNDNNTKNIIDTIFEELLKTNKISEEVRELYGKSFIWKKKLREYRDYNNYTYKEIAEKMSRYGSKYQEQTIRQWMIPESHIVGPQKKETLIIIARVLNDYQLNNDLDEIFKAITVVRKQRREILKLMDKAINSKLAGKICSNDEVLNIVYANVDKLADIYEVENIQKLDEIINAPANLVNKPLTREEIGF